MAIPSVLAGEGAVTIASGTTVLNGVNTYLGATTVKNGASLGGTGTLSGNLIFEEGSTLAVANASTPLTANGVLKTPEGGIEVVLPEEVSATTIPLIKSTTELTADLFAVNVAYARELTSSTVEGVTTYTLSYVKKNFYEEGLYTTVTADNYWSLATWSDKNGIVYAAGEIDWTQVQKVYLTVNTTAESTLFSSYDLTSLTTVTVTGSGPLTIANWMAQIASGTLAVGGGVTLTLVDLYAADAAVAMTGVTEAEVTTAGTVNFENNSVTNVTAAITLQDGLALSASTDMTLAGGITGDGSLTVAQGTTTLTAANTYTGDTTIASGAKLIINTGSAETWDEVSTAKIIVDGELEYQSTGLVYRGLTGAGKVTINGDNIKIPNTGSKDWECGLSAFTGSVVVNDGKILTLFNWNKTYTINLASLTLTGSGAIQWEKGNDYAVGAELTVSSLSGTGTIGENITVTFASGATLDATAGVLTVNGSVTSTSTAITATGYGPVLTAADVDASKFTTTLDGAMVTATDTALYLTKRPSLVVDETETISDAAAAIIAEAAAAEGFYEVEMDADSKPVDGLELFTNVDLELTVDEADKTKGTVKVAYDFGIESFTVEERTVTVIDENPQLYVILTVTVDNAAHDAGYGDNTKLKVLLNNNDITTDTVVIDDEVTETGAIKIAVPYRYAQPQSGETIISSETFKFTVRATNQ